MEGTDGGTLQNRGHEIHGQRGEAVHAAFRGVALPFSRCPGASDVRHRAEAVAVEKLSVSSVPGFAVQTESRGEDAKASRGQGSCRVDEITRPQYSHDQLRFLPGTRGGSRAEERRWENAGAAVFLVSASQGRREVCLSHSRRGRNSFDNRAGADRKS